MKKIFYQGALAKNIFLGDAFKLEKDGPILPVFESMSILALSSNRTLQETVSVSGKREVSEKRQTSATGKTHKKQRPVHIPSFFLHILLNGSPHSLRACIRSGFRLNCHHSPEKRTPVMQASQLA